MDEATRENIGRVCCGDCKWFNIKSELHGVESTCKRLDHKKYQFSRPYFKSYDCGQFIPAICRDFMPNEIRKYLKEHWTDFDDWVGDIPETSKIGLVVNGDTSVRYYVRYKDFANGTFIDAEGNLKCVERCFYKKCSKNKNPIGYILVHEKPEEPTEPQEPEENGNE